MSQSYIVTGTDTDVGKTVVAAGLVQALGASYWKPIQAGLAEGTDCETVARLAGVPSDRLIPEAYRLATPCSPHEAARIDGIAILRSRLALPPANRPLIVEGAGGVMVPFSGTERMIDLFADWALPIILVASTRLGTINHSLLSLEALHGRGLAVAGILFVGDANAASETVILGFGGVRHLGRLPWLDPLTPEALAAAFAAGVRTNLLQ